MDNLLIHQKDHILALVRDDKYEEALLLLNFVRPMWEQFDYLYKYEEIKRNMEERCREQAIEATHWKTEQKWRNIIQLIRA